MKYCRENKKLNISAFQHPRDLEAVKKITALPGFKKILSFLSENTVEKSFHLMNNSSLMKISPDMSPKIHSMVKEAVDIFDVGEIPDIYIDRRYEMLVRLDGMSKPFIVFSTSVLEQYDDEMLFPLIASEVAGIKAGHATIKFVDSILKIAKPIIPFAIDIPVTIALNDWYRSKAYTYDRAFLLVSESFELAAKEILFGEVSVNVLQTLNLDKPNNTYLEQAQEFGGRDGAEGLYQKFNTVFSRNQWLASRYVELYNWYNSGEYQDVLEGSVR